MKTMTCNQLGVACNKEFQANSFAEIAEMSQKHGTEMFHINDTEHLKAMSEINDLMQTPDDMKNWFKSKKNEFSELPED